MEDIKNYLLQNDNYIIAGHIDPDFDCIYSQLSLANLLENLGKKVTLINEGPFNKSFLVKFGSYFIKNINNLEYTKDSTLIIVDCSTEDRIGNFSKLADELTTIIIDHHSNGENHANYKFIDANSPSTTLLIKTLFDFFNIEIKSEVAEMLLHGFCTDTGFFRHLKVNVGKYLKNVADLTDLGASLKRCYNEMYYNKSRLSRLYLSIMIKRAKSYSNGKLIFLCENKSIAKKYANNRDSDTLYDVVMATENCEAIVYFKYVSKHKTIVGLRAKDKINVGSIAAKYGGGGHKAAAGFSFPGSIKKIKNIIKLDFEN